MEVVNVDTAWNYLTDYKTPKTLDNFGVQLVWKGTGTMVMGRNDLEDGYRLADFFASKCSMTACNSVACVQN